MKSASGEAPHEIGHCCADFGRAGFLDKLQALDGQLRRRLDAPFSPKMPVFIFGSVSMNQNVIFI
jgi:hypothetical protein